MPASLPRLIAFYLPQYHPIPENDAWWGKGFTEWTNVAQARPQFRGHYQPHLPADLGFYDLRLPEVRLAQAELAREYGIHGFCYYHYWFHGKRLLGRPFDEVLRTGQPDFPFCLCWANEKWTRAWDGKTNDTLIAQSYSPDDDLNHIRWLAPAFQDPRYLRHGDKPIFLIYRPFQLPNPAQTIERWRTEALRLGIGELFIGAVEGNDAAIHADPTLVGFDAAVEFLPNSRSLPPAPYLQKVWRHSMAKINPRFSHRVIDYRRFAEFSLAKPAVSYPRFPCVVPSWDNSPRRNRFALILRNSTPSAYGEWLSTVVHRLQTAPKDDRIIFVNAWNEWGEGDHLEPCQKWGDQYLNATRAALTENAPGQNE